MTQKFKPEQTPAPAPNPAPVGKAEQPNGAPFSKTAVAELTDTDLQAVTGGGGPSGGVLRDGGRGGLGGEV